MATNKQILKQQKHSIRAGRVRARVSGSDARPRLAVFRSASHIYAQIINDLTGKTLAQSSSKDVKVKGAKTDLSVEVGKAIAEKAKAAGITKVVFDRGGFKYHGRVKALAEAAREAGLEF
jgi:large subunit ribosomal protein L18